MTAPTAPSSAIDPARTALPLVLEQLAARQHGVVGRAQLREAGVSRAAVHRSVQRGLLVPVTRKVLRVAGSAPTPRRAAMAAVLDLAPCSAICRTSGLALAGVRDFRLVPVHALVPRPQRTSLLEPARVHTTRRLTEDDLTTIDGIPVTTPARTVFDLGWTLSPPALERLLERVWGLGLVDHAAMAAVLERCGGRGIRPSRLLRPMLEARGPGYRPTDSGLEARVLQILRAAGLAFRHQVVVGDRRPIGRIDFRHQQRPALLEVHSRIHHEGLLDRARDAERRHAAEAAGFVVGEVWEDQVWHHPHEVEAEARRIIGLAAPA